MVPKRHLLALATTAALLSTFTFAGASPNRAGGRGDINPTEMREWLNYLSSDELEGRDTFSEGLGLAAAYIEDHLKQWNIKPGGDNGSYLQTVRVLGVKSTNHSTITVESGGQVRTFENGKGISFPANAGGKQTITSDQIEFLGYGLDAPLAGHNDYAGKEVKGKIVVWLGPKGPKGIDLQKYRRALFGRSRYATEQKGATASIGPELRPGNRRPAAAPAPALAGGQPPPGFPRRLPVENADFTTVQRLDSLLPPAVTAEDDFLTFLFSAQPVSYADLKQKAGNQEPLPSFALKDVKITVNLNADYRVVRTQFTHNVIGIVEGSDTRLKDTYVAYGAHYDHVGYAEGEIVNTEQGPARAGAVGRVTDGAIDDRIWNGADDDGSGTVTEMAIARAFATGQKHRRSILFVWHAGEEKGLWGSRYYADYPTVPISKIVAQVNMDMVGRNRDNKPEEADTVYVVGDDRISTDFHNIVVDANASLDEALKLDYEMNDPTDLEQVYYRSDHYSYAAKGIPIVFLTTGLHPDYHANTDSADKIIYPKMAKIGKLAFEIGNRVADMEHPPVRDNRGPRMGKGSSGKLKL